MNIHERELTAALDDAVASGYTAILGSMLAHCATTYSLHRLYHCVYQYMAYRDREEAVC